MSYTPEQIRAAFWKTFHKQGELWFDYLSSDDECEASTKLGWEQFENNLREKGGE